VTATAKFYTVLAVVLIAIVGVSYWAGYKSGFHAGAASVRSGHSHSSHPAP
jgi:type IV secretory pathway VirB2 component (pilin)